MEYPERVGSWLAATARNECLRSLAAHKRVVLGHGQGEIEISDQLGLPVGRIGPTRGRCPARLSVLLQAP